MAIEEATLYPVQIEGEDYRLTTERADIDSIPVITHTLEVLGTQVPVITQTLEVGGMIQTPVDDTLSIEDMAADAKATGDRIAAVASDLADFQTDYADDMNREASSGMTPGVLPRLTALEGRTGEDINISSAASAGTIAEVVADVSGTVASHTQRLTALEQKTGSDIPESSATGVGSIASALSGIRRDVAGHTTQLNNLTGATIQESTAAGAGTIAAALADLRSSVRENTQDIQTIEEDLGNKAETVDGLEPDTSGEITLSAVRYVEQTLTQTQKTRARTNIDAASTGETNAKVLTFRQPISMSNPYERNIRFNMAGITADHVVIDWRASTDVDLELSITTSDGYFSLDYVNNTGSTQTIQPIFALPYAPPN